MFLVVTNLFVETQKQVQVIALKKSLHVELTTKEESRNHYQESIYKHVDKNLKN